MNPDLTGPAALTPDGVTVSAAGTTDADDLARILADDLDIDACRQAIADRHVLDGGAPMMSALARVAGLVEQLGVEVTFIRKLLGGGT